MQFTATSMIDLVGNPFIKVSMIGENNKSTIRTLTIAQFIKVLGGATKEEREFVKLRENFFPKSQKAVYFSDYLNYTCIWEEGAKERLLVLKTPLGDKHYHVPFPTLIFRITVKDGQVVSKYCFARKKNSKTICRYPFGNVSNSGSICMGNISANDMTCVEDFSDDFFMGVTNNDYYRNGEGRVTFEVTQEQLLDKLSALKEFPDNWLVESDVTEEQLLDLKKFNSSY